MVNDNTFKLQQISKKIWDLRFMKIQLDEHRYLIIDVMPNVFFLMIPFLNRVVYLPAKCVTSEDTLKNKKNSEKNQGGELKIGAVTTAFIGGLIAKFVSSVTLEIPKSVTVAISFLIVVLSFPTFNWWARKRSGEYYKKLEGIAVFVKLKPEMNYQNVKGDFACLLILVFGLGMAMVGGDEFINSSEPLTIIFFIFGGLMLFMAWFFLIVRSGEAHIQYKGNII